MFLGRKPHFPAMCIVYFASHPSCTHYHILGAWNCSLDCPIDTRHTFYITDSGFTCSACDFLGSKELDPEKNPVAYYPPMFQVEKAREDRREMRAEKGVKEGISGRQDDEGVRGDYKALSDVDSLTGEWRRSPTPSSLHNNESAHHFTPVGLHPFPPQATPRHTADRGATPDTTPRTAAHRTLVQEQLDKLAAARRMEGQGHPSVPVKTDPQGNHLQVFWDRF
jgi:hypothetical protein